MTSLTIYQIFLFLINQIRISTIYRVRIGTLKGQTIRKVMTGGGYKTKRNHAREGDLKKIVRNRREEKTENIPAEYV